MNNNPHLIKDIPVETTVLKGKSENNDFNIELGKGNYVISDTGGIDTLTFKNTRLEDLEYSTKGDRTYIRDKKSQNVVTFDDTGYTERKQKLDLAHVEFDKIYQEIDMHELNKISHSTKSHYSEEMSEFVKVYDLYQRNLIPPKFLSEASANVVKELDVIIKFYDESGIKEQADKFITIKNIFHDYTYKLINLNIDHTSVIEKINISGEIYDAKKLLLSKPLDNLSEDYTLVKESSELTDLAHVKMLKNSLSDYTKEEVIRLEEKQYSQNTMIEYMAEFKDLGQELGIQELPSYSDYYPMPLAAIN
ncbi:hypothetical protein [Yersinia bercovieri]|uniref:hypothetical protein n=1 Tax=Yersinia bercovieri TaxID=634 RepID=UPI0011AB5108|nr:hypothetical protein [Yersinia bercovieri]